MIFEKTLDDLIPYNKDYKDALYNLKEKSPGVKKSNSGGWHSDNILELASFISLKRVIKYTIQTELFLNQVDFYSMWGNINPTSTWNERHNHSDFALSGCYYVQAGWSSGNFLIEEDDDYLNLPKPKEIISEPGMILLFDANYYHSVKENLSNYDRISIAFNIGKK